MGKLLLIFVSLAAVLIGCNNSSGSTSSGSDSLLIDRDSLFLTDSIGVLMGDSCYVFGTIADILPVEAGYAVLDQIYCRITVYDHQGQFLYSGCRAGEGPGELSYPYSFCRLPGGEYFVYDFGDRSAVLLDDSLNYISSFTVQMNVPVNITAGGDSSVVIKQLVIEFQDETLMAGYQIISMNAYTGELGVIYREYMAEMGADEVDITPEYACFTTDSHGNVYLADMVTDEYAIDVLSPAGDTLGRIEREPGPRIDYDVECHQIHFFPVTMPLTTSSGTSTLKLDTPELHPIITALEIDGEGNIWVRGVGDAVSESWDVLSPDGELLREVVLFSDTTGAASYPSLHVSPCGFVATRLENEVERFYLVRE